MTILETRERRRRARLPSRLRSPVRRAKEVIVPRIPNNWWKRRVMRQKRREEAERATKRKPCFDVVTTEAVKRLVAQLVYQTGVSNGSNGGSSPPASCTVYQLASILTRSRVVDLYTTQLREDDGYYDDSTGSGFMGSDLPDPPPPPLSKTVEKQRRTQGWYRLQNAKLTLQHRSGAIENRVASWEEARQYLEDVVIFPNGEGQEESDGAAAADDASNHLEEYTKRVQNLRLDDAMKKVGMSGAELRMQQLANLKLSHEIEDREFAASGEQLEAAYEEREKRLQSDAVKEVDEALKKEERDEEARKRASELMRPLTDDEATLVRNTLYEIGPGSEVVAQEGPDTVQRGSIQRLRPDVWLNDEVIHFFYVMLSKRDAELCAADPNRKRCHFFKSFFMTKLLNEGHRDPSMDGVYEYKNVKRWSKKVPGKDIFNLDKIFFPINVGGSHWICAVAFMQEKRIQMYDSFYGSGHDYLRHILQYLKDEHLDKKKSPLPNPEEWVLVPTQPDTPKQANCDDCGVFTCMFADFVSMGYPLSFNQSHITQCRERIALAIMNGKAIV